MKLTTASRAAIKARVLDVCTQLISEGSIPSEKQLRDWMPGYSATMLASLRDELREEGRLRWSHLTRPVQCSGLTGRTAGERKEIRAAIERERARKLAAGPERESSGLSEADLLARRQRVYRDPHGSRRSEPAACSPHGSPTRE